jgi:hypothetical protein
MLSHSLIFNITSYQNQHRITCSMHMESNTSMRQRTKMDKHDRLINWTVPSRTTTTFNNIKLFAQGWLKRNNMN